MTIRKNKYREMEPMPLTRWWEENKFFLVIGIPWFTFYGNGLWEYHIWNKGAPLSWFLFQTVWHEVMASSQPAVQLGDGPLPGPRSKRPATLPSMGRWKLSEQHVWNISYRLTHAVRPALGKPHYDAVSPSNICRGLKHKGCFNIISVLPYNTTLWDRCYYYIFKHIREKIAHSTGKNETSS